MSDAEKVMTEDPMAEFDEAPRNVIENFDEHAKRRCADLLDFSSTQPALRAMLERAFCLGYKAGVVDTNAAAKFTADRGGTGGEDDEAHR